MTSRTGSWREPIRSFHKQYGPEPTLSNDNRIGGQRFFPPDAVAKRPPLTRCCPLAQEKRRARSLFPDDAIDATDGFLECLKGFVFVLVILLALYASLIATPNGG